jgi:signal transduction histidine kinase
MTVGSNLSLRLAAIMLLGFIALQVLIVVAALPEAGGASGRYLGLPRPEEVVVLADAIERAPPDEREALIDALDGGALYSLRLAPGPIAARRSSNALDDLAMRYRAAAPERPIRVDGRRPRLSRWIGESARLVRFFAPITVAVGLEDGSVIVISSQPSAELRAYQQRRASIAAFGGLTLLVVLMLAVRQTTRPLGALSRGVRRFAGNLDAPDLRIEGPGEVRALAVAFNDMKAQIRELVAERTRVLGAIAHDLRTYLTRLRLRAEFIGDAEHRKRAVRDLEEMNALVNDALFVADLESAPPAEPEPVPLHELLGDIVEVHVAMGAKIGLEPIPRDLLVAATPLALRRIIENLIANGLRHGSHVTIAAYARGRSVHIVVEDDGPGVPDEALPYLGLPFQRFDPSRSRETGGAGLGLAIVRALAARDQAEVTFERATPHGLRVTLRYLRAAT